MTDWNKLQRALHYATRNPGKNVRLSNLAAETGQSPFHARIGHSVPFSEKPPSNSHCDCGWIAQPPL
jgi:hypothetical protein